MKSQLSVFCDYSFCFEHILPIKTSYFGLHQCYYYIITPPPLQKKMESINTYAAVNGKLELTLLKGRQRFDTVSTSNLKV